MNILIAIVILSIIIIIHELGHFLLAKANGVAVTEFSLGLGPTLLKTKKNGTIFSLKLLPFGGACMMAGEDGVEVAEADKETLFSSKSVWARISIVAAGPIFNFILAFVMAVFIIGSIGYDPCVVYSADENSAAAEAGLMPGDVIKSVNGKTINFYKEFSFWATYNEGEVMKLVYQRDGETYTTTLIPEYIEMDVYQLGVYLGADATISEVSSGSVAEAAGFKAGDVIKAVNGTVVATSEEAIELIRGCGGETVLVTIMRGSTEMDIPVTPVKTHYAYFETGLSFSGTRVKTNPIETIKYAALEVKYWISMVIDSLKLLVTGNVSKDDVAGPVGIVSAIGNVVEKSKPDGVFYIILNLANWVVMLSANLGVMNLLPLPALDGGRLLFMIIEVFRGKPVDQKIEGMVHFVGMVLLMLLMVFILFNDISNLF